MVTIHAITLRGLSFHYEERGDKSKSPAIFIHGSASDYRTWETQLDTFAQKYHVFAYSRRSHYSNPYAEYGADYSVQAESDDLAALIEGLKLTQTPPHLIGWSYGAFIAAVTAKNYSHLARSLVLAEPPILSFLTDNGAAAQSYRSYASKASAIPSLLNAGKYREAVEAFIDAVNGAGAFEHTPPEQQKRMLDNAKTLFELTTPERDPFSASDAQAIDVPTLLLSGERSPLFLQKIASELVNCLKKKENAVIKNAGHAMHRQSVNEYNRAVLDFLDRH